MRFQSPIATTPPVTTDGRITELHLWAVREGLRRAPAAAVFEDFCRRLVAAGLPLWRAFVGMRTLHPQWAGYTYTWWRDRDVVDPSPREHGEAYDQDLRESPYTYLRDTALGGGLPQRLRRRLAGSGAQRDFAVPRAVGGCRADRLFRRTDPRWHGDGGVPRQRPGLLLRDRSPRGFQRRRSPVDRGGIARGVAGDHIGCGAYDCRRPARRVSRQRCRPACSCRCGRARFGREHSRRAMVRRHPRLHANRRRNAGAGSR